MPRVDEIYARKERESFRRQFGGAGVALVTTTIIPHERNDRKGRECPCCGSVEAHELGRIEDLAVLIDRHSGQRNNRWKQASGDGSLAEFDAIARAAEPWGTPESMVWHAPIVYRVAESHVDVLCDDTSEVILFSGGWRSGKTVLADDWWTRGWVLRGGRGERFVLTSPSLNQTFKNMQKIFLGRDSMPALLPTIAGPQGPIPMLAHDLPEKHTSSHQHFPMIDAAVVELYHLGHGHGGHVEGDTFQRVHFDEAARVRSPDAFDVLKGRVMQCKGGVGVSTVPDDEGMWIYDKIVAPFEQGTAKHARVFYMSSYDNVFIDPESVRRREESEQDPKVVEEKIHGRWTRRGAYAYGDVWSDDLIIETNSHDPEAWGFKADCTKLATRGLWAARTPGDTDGVSYGAGADSNWSPQTAAAFKVFGDPEHPKTWTMCWLAELTLDGDTEMAANALAKLDGGRYRGRTGIICDASMFHDANYHGGHANRSNDAAEYKRLGFRAAPPIRVGRAPSNPGVMQARGLVRIMMRLGRMLFSEIGCPQLIAAMPKVPNRPKAPGEAGSHMDRKIYNLDDTVRYPSWRFFSKRLLPTRPGPQIEQASNGPHRAA